LAFLSIFTVELLLHLIYRGWLLFQDGWLNFDFVIIVMTWSLESLQIVRAFRIFRAIRLVTRFGPLRDLVQALGKVLPRLYAIACLLLLILYIFAVLTTELFRDTPIPDFPLSEGAFRTLDASLFTLFDFMTIEWSDVTRQIMRTESWAWMPIMSYLWITGFIVYNLIVAVVCDAVYFIDKETREANEKEADESAEWKLSMAQVRICHLADQIQDLKQQYMELHQLIAMLGGDMAQQQPCALRQHDQRNQAKVELLPATL
jgi:hypothetical protein